MIRLSLSTCGAVLGSFPVFQTRIKSGTMAHVVNFGIELLR